MNYQLLTGDAIEVMRSLSAGSVQMVCTSPPYFALRSYLDNSHPDKALEIGSESTPDAYVAKLVAVFREVKRVLRPDGVVFLNLGDSYNGSNAAMGGGEASSGLRRDGRSEQSRMMGIGKEIARRRLENVPTKNVAGLKPKDLIGIPWMVAFALRADGWYLRSEIIWHKRAPMPESVTDRPTKAHEQVFLLTKAANYYYDAEAIREPNSPTSQMGGAFVGNKKSEYTGNGHSGLKVDDNTWVGRNRRSVWTLGPEFYAGAHFAVMPTKLVEPCILAGTSAYGCCAKCGAPWERITEKGEIERHPLAKNYQPARMAATAAGQGTNGLGKSSLAMTRKTEHIGWQPTCTCGADVVPCTVLDPFLGSGTVVAVALKHGRRGVGIDLSSQYIEMAHDRIGRTQPLLLAAD